MITSQRFFIWLGIALIFTTLAVVGTLQWQLGFESHIPLADIRHPSGHLFVASVPKNAPAESDSFLAPLASATVLEDSRPLEFRESSRADILENGHGRYRVTKDRVLFSSSDGTSPGQNGHAYTLVVPFYHAPPWLLILLWAFALIAWAELPFAHRFIKRLLSHIDAKRPTTILDFFCARLLPIPFFAGVLLGIALCIGAGQQASKKDVYHDRDRFFMKVSPEGNIYPTLENLEQFVRGKASPNKVLILVGGSSILLGVGQTNDHLWTNRLQQELGDAYSVVNISFRAAQFTSIAMPLAEKLSSDYHHIILLTDAVPFAPSDFLLYQPGSYAYPYDYVLWQAWIDGYLSKNSARENALSSALRSPVEAIRLHAQEQFLHALLERFFFASDLWNTIGYQRFFTVYSPLLPDKIPFYTRRSAIPDDESMNHPSPAESIQKNWRTDFPILQGLYLSHARTTPDGSLESTPSVTEFARLAAQKYTTSPAFPAKLLFLVTSRSPILVDYLNTRDKARFEFAITESVRAYQEAGFDAIPLGLHYPADCYVDTSHFSNAASTRMARDVASEVEKIAHRERWTHEHP
jgi:hypothetical protein